MKYNAFENKNLIREIYNNLNKYDFDYDLGHQQLNEITKIKQALWQHLKYYKRYKYDHDEKS